MFGRVTTSPANGKGGVRLGKELIDSPEKPVLTKVRNSSRKSTDAAVYTR